MSDWEKIVKTAKLCNTKQTWESLFLEFGSLISTINTSRPVSEIFKRLKNDPQSLEYSELIFSSLIKGCLSSWNLELGQEICQFSSKLSSPLVAIPAAKLFMEAGLPIAARQVAQRSLRHLKISDRDKLQLDMLVCSSFAEDGKHSKATGMLRQLEKDAKIADLEPVDLADLNIEIGRVLFFLGQYHEAGKFFRKGSIIHLDMKDWENAAKSLFNTAMCYHNGGEKRDEGFVYVEEARRIADTHNFPGPLSHIESFYGLDAFHHGNFADAREHFRRSLEVIPTADKGYRRLHIISMLALTYLAQGKYRLGRQFGRQTLELARLDESDKYQMRYLSLEAELFWEDGLTAESQAMLSKAVASFKTHGIHTLEELSAYSRYLTQSAMLGSRFNSLKVTIDEGLKKNSFNWLDYLNSEALIKLAQNRFDEAKESFIEIEEEAVETGDRYHLALGLLGQIKALLATRQLTDELKAATRKFEVAVGRIGDTPLRTNVHFVNAAIAFLEGDFQACTRNLRAAAKNPKTSFADKFVVNCWLDTTEGRSSRLTHDWQINLLSSFTKLYFAPTIEIIGNRKYRISNHYIVSLEKHPSLDDMLQYLFQKSNFRAEAKEIQTNVWKQNLQMVGWQQKIRNTNMRIRDFFPYTMAPLILHHDDIYLFSSAIDIRVHNSTDIDRGSEIKRLLADQPMTSSQLSERLQVSPATVKRTLKKMIADQELETSRTGRNIYYGPKLNQSNPEESANQ